MPWPHASNQIALNEWLYFFESPARGTTTCLILCHSGDQVGLPKHLAHFLLPPGITLRFGTHHGLTLDSDIGTDILSSAGVHPGSLAAYESATGLSFPGCVPTWPKRHVVGPTPVRNYLVQKLGSPHDEGVGEDYQSMELYMRHALGITGMVPGGTASAPHIVTLRNRRAPAQVTLTLGAVIRSVLTAQPDIREFHFVGCRAPIPRPDSGCVMNIMNADAHIERVKFGRRARFRPACLGKPRR